MTRFRFLVFLTRFLTRFRFHAAAFFELVQEMELAAIEKPTSRMVWLLRFGVQEVNHRHLEQVLPQMDIACQLLDQALQTLAKFRVFR